MIVEEGQAQRCIKATNWGSLERSQELQLRAQPSNSGYSQAQATAGKPHRAIPRAFPKSVNKQNSGVYTKYDNQVLMIITINFRMFFKEKSGLPSDDNFT